MSGRISPVNQSQKQFIREQEQSGKPPKTAVYKDHKGIRTISTGYNLEAPGAEETFKKVLNVSSSFFNDVKYGRRNLTLEQTEKLETSSIAKTKEILVNKIGIDHYNKLSPNKKEVLISLCHNAPALIGPNLIRYIQQGDYESAGQEILHRSNREQDQGVQNRRNREFEHFQQSSFEESKQEVSPQVGYSHQGVQNRRNREFEHFQQSSQEQSGKPPKTAVYKDHKGIRTISTGYNLEAPGAEETFKKVLNVSSSFFNDVKYGRRNLTLEQAEELETSSIAKTKEILVNKLEIDHYNKLSPNKKETLISMCHNGPGLIGPNLTKNIQQGDYESAGQEILHRSNREKHQGIQNRRNREFEHFQQSSFEESKQEVSPQVGYSHGIQNRRNRQQSSFKESKQEVSPQVGYSDDRGLIVGVTTSDNRNYNVGYNPGSGGFSIGIQIPCNIF